MTPNLTLNLGLRYDYQQLTPETKSGFAPRLGFAYDPTGTGKTVIRGGVGKFYEYTLVGVANTLNRFGVYGQTFTFQTNEDTSADRGVIPTSHACLQPTGSGGLAVISPACRAFLTSIRNSLQPGASTQFVNTEPQLDGDRRMGYLWSYSVGVKHELMPSLAVGVDYVGNRGRDQTAQIDISEGPVGPNGRIIRLTPDQFDPTGELIPASARGRELPARAAVSDARRLQQRFRFARALAREAVHGSLERARRLHAGVRQRRRAAERRPQLASRQRSRPARRLRPGELRQPARLRRQLQRDAVRRIQHRRDRALLLGLSDQRDDRHRRQRRSRQHRSAGQAASTT